ncbi:MAG: hypothetical protein ABI304_01655 [Rudaea sp.]
MHYLIIALVIAVALMLLVWLNSRHLRHREHSIRALLDGADALEARLHECKRRMQRLRGMLTVLPEEMSATADHALSADAKVKAALQDLLAHRLWIQQHATTASQSDLDNARAAMTQSSATLGAQVDRLGAITADLESAQASAKTVVPRMPS